MANQLLGNLVADAGTREAVIEEVPAAVEIGVQTDIVTVGRKPDETREIWVQLGWLHLTGRYADHFFDGVQAREQNPYLSRHEEK